ncbi:MAG TPA: extracellular solute-binding protein [Anaerolineales bacterium]|nr:extracellular solute-binding protein [Anaerolineales bacterium]
MSRIFRFVISAGLIFLTGCASLEPFLASLTPPTPVPTIESTPAPTKAATATAPAAPEEPLLRVWLPPQFDLAAENEPANLLRQRLEEFETAHPGLEIEVRIKASEGENSIVNVLSLTSSAAPGTLPDLIVLSRSDLEAAAMRGLLHPIDGLSTSLEDPNWYGYAQQLGRIQNTGYGLPFAGNALVLAYYSELGTIVNWDDVLASRGRLVFPAGNLQGLVGLSLYASAGGEILDAQGLPTLEEEALTRTLALVQEGVSKNVFPASLANVATEAQALQIYRTESANKAVIWILDYEASSDGEVAPLPGVEEVPFSYATGWLWALAGANPENQQLAVELAEHLVAEEFIGEWTRAANYLPTRPTTLGENDRTMAAVIESAHPIPSNEVLTVLGPLMQEALTRVLNGEAPEEVAASVVQKLK